jgi:ABC-type multidrug transport system permease subunit
MRNPQASKARIGQTIIIGLLALSVFYKINGPRFEQRMNMAGSVFFITVNSLMTAFMGTIGLFQNERPVFLREQANNMYSVSAYFNAKTLTEVPLTTLTPLLYTIIVYFGMGFTVTASQFFVFFFSLWCLI